MPKIIMAVFFLFFVPLSLQAQSPAQDSFQYYNSLLSPTQMKEDLQLFWDIRKQVNSGLYAYRTPQQIDSIYKMAYEQVKRPLKTLDFFKILLQLTDYEGSCHNHTAPALELVDFLKRQICFFPYPMVYIEGRMIFDGNNAVIPAGSRILSVNGVSDKELMQSFYKYYPSDGFNTTAKLSASVNKAFSLNYVLEYGITDKYTLTYTKPNSTTVQQITLPAVSFAQRTRNDAERYSAPVADLLDFKRQPPYSLKIVNASTAVLNLRWFGMVSGEEDPGFAKYTAFLDSVFVVLKEKKIANLIIDVRNNPGGADPTFEQPVRYLTDESFKENLKAHIIFDPYKIPFEQYFWGVSMAEPMDSAALAWGKSFLKGRFPIYKNGRSYQYQKFNPVYTPLQPKFEGEVFLLINEHVASAASHFASLVKAYVNYATVVGVETTGGYYVHNGHSPMIYKLPNSKIKTQFSIVHVVQDAPLRADQPSGGGIMPDYEVWPTLKDFLDQKDTQMEFVLQLIKQRHNAQH